MSNLKLKDVAKLLPKELIKNTALTLLGKGLSEDEIIDQLVDLIDQELDFTQIIKNPVIGEAIEAVDGPIIKLIVSLIVKNIKKH